MQRLYILNNVINLTSERVLGCDYSVLQISYHPLGAAERLSQFRLATSFLRPRHQE